MNIALDEIGEIGDGWSWEKATFGAARLPNFGCVRGTKNSFFRYSIVVAGNSPVQPLSTTPAFCHIPRHTISKFNYR
jgi:hypothetical protein